VRQEVPLRCRQSSGARVFPANNQRGYIFAAGVLNAAPARQWSSDEAMFNLHELPRAAACHPQITIKTQSPPTYTGREPQLSAARIHPNPSLRLPLKLDTL